MTLEQASFFAQIISAVTVVASLIFVGVQLRQNTRAVRAATSQAHSATYQEVISHLIDNAEVARIWRIALADPEKLGEDERVRFLALTSALFRFYESSQVKRRRGQLDPEHWHTIEQQAINLAAQPGIKAWWVLRRHWHSKPFQEWFEALEAPTSPALYDIKAAVAAQPLTAKR
jgi:hypothetical protein